MQGPPSWRRMLLRNSSVKSKYFLIVIDVLKDSNIEDLDLSKVAAKALHNLTGENNYWTLDLIQKLDEILSGLGEELDSIMVTIICMSANRTWLTKRNRKNWRDLGTLLTTSSTTCLNPCSTAHFQGADANSRTMMNLINMLNADTAGKPNELN